MSSNISENLPIRKYDKICEYQRDSIKHNIIQYYVKVESVFTSAGIQKYLNEKCNIVCSLKIIRDIMKRDLDFTYKKCKTRSNVVDFSKVKALRVLFSVNLAKQLKERILLWNIDEWTISQNTKSNYSWSIKGLNKETKNSPFAGNLYIILTIHCFDSELKFNLIKWLNNLYTGFTNFKNMNSCLVFAALTKLRTWEGCKCRVLYFLSI